MNLARPSGLQWCATALESWLLSAIDVAATRGRTYFDEQSVYFTEASVAYLKPYRLTALA